MRLGSELPIILVGTALVIVQPLVVAALTATDIYPIAQQITVRIDGANTGSGVIIERQGNNYTVVTNWHVVQLEGSYTIQTPDGKQYNFNHSQVRRLSGVDLAVFQFTSNQNYRVAEKGNSDQITGGKTVHVAGYPEGTSDLQFLSGSISSLVRNPKDGYALVYTVNAFPGMSGGPILDEQGKLVGIHGRANTRPDTNATTVYGIPLKTYLSLALSAQPVATAPPPQPRNTPVSPLKPVNPNNASNDWTLVKTLQSHSKEVHSVTWSKDGKTLASGGYDSIKIWNVDTWQETHTLNAPVLDNDSVAFSSNSKTLASINNGDHINIWNVATGQKIRTLKGHFSTVYSLAFSSDGKTLASCSDDKTVIIWNTATGQKNRTLKGHSDIVTSVAFSPDGRNLASAGYDQTIKIWNVITGQQIANIKSNSTIFLVAFSPDGKSLASLNYDKTIKIWNVTTGEQITNLKAFGSFAFNPDGKTLASGGYDSIKIWNLATGQEISTLKGHSDGVTSVAFSPSGRTLASGSTDATIKIWRLSE